MSEVSKNINIATNYLLKNNCNINYNSKNKLDIIDYLKKKLTIEKHIKELDLYNINKKLKSEDVSFKGTLTCKQKKEVEENLYYINYLKQKLRSSKRYLLKK